MRKIALFMGEFGEYQIELSGAIIQEAKKADAAIQIFTNSGSYGSNLFHALGEKTIIRIPNLADYDGIILAPDTFGITGMYDELAELILREAKCPVVCIRKGDDRFYNVLIDNYSAMRTMVEHFITVHGYRKICFMTGIMSLKDAWDRRQGYLDVMQEYGIPVTGDMIFEGDYWKNKGEEAAEHFLAEGRMPEAIICSNDYMAVSVCDALLRRGIRIPEDIAVSGFDDTEEARCSVPSISSMVVPNDDLGIAAYRILDNLWNQRPQEKNVMVEVKTAYKESCGCSFELNKELLKKRFFETEDIRKVLYRNVHMNADFENTNSFEELAECARRYITMYSYEAIYICACDDAESREETAEHGVYTENMILRAVITPQKTTILNKRFKRTDLLPQEYLTSKMPLYVAALHARDDCMGYVALQTEKIAELRFFFQIWTLGFANAIDRQRMYHENRDLLEMRLQYNRDELTGIGNRREIEKILRNRHQRLRTYGEGFCVVSIDMDGLKIINDTYGHLEGDIALKAMAEILDKSKGKKGDVARTGGDEYIMCLGTNEKEEIEKTISEVRTQIAAYNERSQKPYQLSASIGYACCRKGMSVVDCMQISDERMYREKRKKKQKAEKIRDKKAGN